MTSAGPPILTQPVFTILAHLVEERAGLHYASTERELFAQKVAPQVEQAGFDSFLDYYYFLRYDPAGPDALQKLLESLTVHETYFFREFDGLTALIEGVLRPASRPGHKLRVWCAACATGEEPLSLAMMLERAQLPGPVEIVASDLSEAALTRAQRDSYSLRSLRSPPPGFVGTWLSVDGDRVTVDVRLRDKIIWKRCNLVDAEQVRALGTFDAILCRNVLIYFNDATARRVVSQLAAALRPEGRLAVGASESLLRFGSELLCTESHGSFFYSVATR